MSETTPAVLESGATQKRVWYRSPITAAFVLGACNFAAPGLWGAMNSLGAGGQQTPWLVNSANALTFCLMILSATLSSTIANLVGVNWAVFLGGIGFVPYSAALYCNNVFGTRWFVLFGAATCGLSAGLFWGIEAGIAIAYPEPFRLGKFLGIWLSFRVAGQILGGAVNLGLNATRDQAGAVNSKVYIVFIALQVVGPFIAFLLPRPHKVQRLDGKAVKIYSHISLWEELKKTGKVFFTKEYILVIPLIAQAVFPESYTNTYMATHFTVRVRALGSFVAAWACIIVGNGIGKFLDAKNVSLKTRARAAFIFIMTTRGAWWIWAIIIDKNFPGGGEAIDWTSPYFGRTFALYVFLGASFQTHYLFLYFIIKSIVSRHEDATRAAGLLRAVESAAQAVAYGTSSIESFAQLPSAALNFGLWGIAIIPASLVVSKIGVEYFGPQNDEASDEDGEDKLDREQAAVEDKKQ
ncbi:hypothetical protein Q8F55_007302 [Vanrija albida]|uniref:Major facilitator superfamily (MFS) profile domain-containing protein n=1 Tax=Vanrija albida TaxID=181172 RepID=A0ABR3Q022_9TREE